MPVYSAAAGLLVHETHCAKSVTVAPSAAASVADMAPPTANDVPLPFAAVFHPENTYPVRANVFAWAFAGVHDTP
jgi:hypothetical protein